MNTDIDDKRSLLFPFWFALALYFSFICSLYLLPFLIQKLKCEDNFQFPFGVIDDLIKVIQYTFEYREHISSIDSIIKLYSNLNLRVLPP